MTRPASLPWIVRRIPLAGRFYAGKPPRGVTGVATETGTLWKRDSPHAPFIVVMFAADARTVAWLAGSLASRLEAIVVVVDPGGDAASARRTAVDEAESRGGDVSRIGLLAEGASAPGAIAAALPDGRDAGATTRLALVSPLLAPESDVAPAGGAFPPTLLQFARSAGASPVVELEKELRRGGVAVRAIDYTDVADGWALYPRAVRGSARGLDDLVAFFERGLGTQSTFEVIPGWDLH